MEGDAVMKKRVKFSEKTNYYHEREEMSEDLYWARKSDYKQRLMDKMRNERMMHPVFNEYHRFIAYFRQLHLRSCTDEILFVFYANSP